MRLPWKRSTEIERSYPPYWDMASFLFNGNQYGLYGVNTTYVDEKQELPDNTFSAYVQAFYYSNAVVFACQRVRELLFSEARFQFRQLRQGRPGDLFGTADLQILETPWPNGTTRDLLLKMEQDSSIAGNFFGVLRPGNQIRRMRPDWVTIVIGSTSDPEVASYDLDAEVIGYIYHPGGTMSGEDPVPLAREQVCHYAPNPDPLACYRGMSWLTPVIREMMADSAATTHKLKWFEQGAGKKLGIKMDPSTQVEAAKKWIELFKEQHEGVANAYKTMFLGGGMDPIVVGADLEQSDFKVVQGAGETRIAAAASVPPVIVGLSEGLDAATYSNYGLAKKRFADGTMRPLWGLAAGSLAPLVTVPGGAELWYDDRDIAWLREDEKAAAEIRQFNATTMKTLVDGGWEPDAIVAAVLADDFGKLTSAHTGLNSVQLQPPGNANAPPALNGNQPMRELEAAIGELVRDE